MRLHLRLGRPGSGRTEAMVDVARQACLAGRRVWWICLPAQRAGVFRRITDGGFTALGLEVMSSQQMYYRLLAGPDFVEPKPLVVGTARLMRVANALAASTGSVPAPGEAKLFAAAVAELKRFGLSPTEVATIAAGDVEVGRLAAVFGQYQSAMAGLWDYDDVRAQAVALVAEERFRAFLADESARARAGLPDVVVVDGLRELGPLDLRLLIDLGASLETHLSLPTLPPGVDADDLDIVELDSREPRKVTRHLAPNDVAEARFALRSLKRDLAAEGYDALDLAVVAPPGTAAALLALADEYGLPLVDESPKALADTPEGHTLLDLLELSDSPTASKLLAVPELAPLAAEALNLGVAGADALARVARDLGLEERWRWWLRRLRVEGDPVEWTRSLLADVLSLTHQKLSSGFEARLLGMAQEAASLVTGAEFTTWLAMLVRETWLSEPAPGGIAVLDAKLVSGRQFKKVYVLGAVEGAYRAGEREDYFIDEDLRSAAAGVSSSDKVWSGAALLPRRFQGRDEAVAEELLTRAEETVLIASEAGASGAHTPDRRLLDTTATQLPVLPAGSALELAGPPPYRVGFQLVEPQSFAPPEPEAEFLRRYARCGFRTWADQVIGSRARPGTARESQAPDQAAEGQGEWYALVRALRSCATLTPAGLEEIATRFPDFRDWLTQHAAHLTRLTWGARFVHASGVVAYVHAGEREPLGTRGRERSKLYRFVAPTPHADWDWARDLQRDRWSEYIAAAAMLEHSRRAPQFVEVHVWPVLGDAVRVDTTNNSFVAERLQRVVAEAAAAAERLGGGDVAPSPGFWCRDCSHFEVCRRGQRR